MCLPRVAFTCSLLPHFGQLGIDGGSFGAIVCLLFAIACPFLAPAETGAEADCEYQNAG
jgi:hypothetical protein